MTDTQKTSSKPPYASFGAFLAGRRADAGIATQADFAGRLKASQQTISRWEAGITRPREKQLPVIASLLGVDLDVLRTVAGYSVSTVVATFDQPFPIDALSPESFERLAANLLQRLYRNASVHQAGHRGHTQDGTDVLVMFPNKDVYSFQCKRAEEFGPQKVHAAVALHAIEAQKKFLLLSRTASPQARSAIRQHEGWDIWDRDDISSKIRSLPKADQIELVDIFFKGRRFELLGVTEEAVWERSKEFFAPFENRRGLFNHTWSLVGREGALSDLKAQLEDKKVRVLFLLGAGGVGKSRVLKQAIEQYERRHNSATVLFLARTSEITKKSLDELGTKPALLVVDDAHDRSDLLLLFQFASMRENIRLVLALRPYGMEHLKAQASNFSLIDEEITKEVKLEALTLEQAEDLATQVLKRESGPLQAAKDIARLTYDCPLATVVGAQIVAREKKHFELAKNEDAFRSTLFGRFEDVIAGELANASNVVPLKQLLRVLALVQPFFPDDKSLLELVEQLEEIPPHDTNRFLKLLIDGGVLFKRGARYRLSPDVLADYIIEANCVGPQNVSTGYAEKAFDLANERQVESLLLNLSKLDWRRSNGDASNSKLLDGVWKKLKPQSEYDDPHIRAVKAIAFYQPLRAIEFGESLIRRGEFIKQLPEIFKYAAYNISHVVRACEALWQLGRDDPRELNSHPDHPIRILAELCEVQPNKPRDYNEAVVHFGMKLANDPGSWQFRFTPLDILEPIFLTEGHLTSSKNHAITFKPFTVNSEFVAPLRQRVFDLILQLLGNTNLRIAVRAAGAIANAIRYPVGLFNAQISDEVRDGWTKVFVKTLGSIEKTVRSNRFDPLVLVGIARSVSWHAHYGPKETKRAAKAVIAALSTSVDYRVLATLLDGYGTELRRSDRANFDALWKKHLENLARDIAKAFPEADERLKYIGRLLRHIQDGKTEDTGSGHVLFDTLLSASADFVRAAIADAQKNENSPTARFTIGALHTLWKVDVGEARRAVQEFLASGRADLAAAVGYTFASLDFSRVGYGDDERSAVETLLTSDIHRLVGAGIRALRAVARHDPDETIRLARIANVGGQHYLADELLCLFAFGEEVPFKRLSEDDVDQLLAKLDQVPELKGHWTETFLADVSETFPDKLVTFFMQRTERAARENNWKIRPANHGPYVHVPLRVKATAQYLPLLSKVVQWMKNAKFEKEAKGLFHFRSREVFEALFGSFDDSVVRFIEEYSKAANEADFEWIASILHEAPHTFVFSHSKFVIDLLTRAQRIGPDVVKNVASALYASAVGGIRQGVAGEPFPRDLETKANSEKVLADLSRFSPSYELYDGLRKNAEAEIARARQRREDFED